MNIKDFIIPLFLALLTTWVIQYFFFNTDRTKEKDVHSFIAPKKKPLNTEIDFIDEKRPREIERSEINTSWGMLVFSTEGASLESLDFKRYINGTEQLFRTIFPQTQTQREERCFLIALEDRTPYYYQLVDRKDDQERVILTYQADTVTCIMRKTFTIYNKQCKIDLHVDIVPKIDVTSKTNYGIEPRIFYPSPIVPALGQDDVISAIIVYGADVFEKIGRDRLQEERGWIDPSLFGTDDRYFIHTMVRDDNAFTQRAYYKFADKRNLFSILEGPSIKEHHEWALSFYFGPKESSAMDIVDPRLEKTLDYYGWFAPIAKFLLRVLQWLYAYVHNYGLAIIILTALIKLLLLPFTWRSERSMKQRLEMQKKLTYIQQKYKDEPDILARERAELIRTHGMPGLGGCLPILLQLPIFFALSRVLSSSIALYQAPMLWISDLSARDPYYILPILVCVSMLLQAVTVESQQRMSMLAMALVFGAITASFSAGLALYICVSTILSVIQTQTLKLLNIA